jgi:hypothetical protein
MPISNFKSSTSGVVKVTGGGLTAGSAPLFQTTTPLLSGVTYESGVLDLAVSGYSQVQTEVVSDTDGTLQFIFYADAAGTDIIRQLTVPYLAAEGYRLFAAPAFSPYVEYKFVNSASPQGDFFFTTKGLNTALSPQLLAADAFISPAMIATLGRSVIVGKDPGDGYQNVSVAEDGSLEVSLAQPTTAFGEVRTSQPHPIVQIDAVYGIQDNVETFTDASPGTGTVSTSNGLFQCKTGVGVGGYGVIRTRRAVRYRPGQGSIFRWTASFSTPTALSLQAAGAFNTTNGFFVGHDGANNFGVMHRTGGRHEVRTLTISGAAGGAENVQLTLNGVLYSIPVTAGTTVDNANEITDWLNANQGVWEAYQNDSTVKLFGLDAANLNGTYTVSSATLTGSIARDGAGAANTETWVYQGSFSVDQLNGSGPSGMTIDPTKGNVFECDMQYLGFGDVLMKIENPATGRFFTFHKFSFANTRTIPTLLNPTLKVGWVSASLGSTTNLTVGGGSAMGGTDGFLHPSRRPKSFATQRTGVGGTRTSIFAIRCRSTYRGVVQLSEVLPKIAYVSPAGTKACQVEVLLNPTFAGDNDWTYIDENDSIVEYDTAGTTLSATGDTLASFIVAGGTTGTLSFKDLAEDSLNPVHLERGDVLCITGLIVGGGGSAVDASLTWLEES